MPELIISAIKLVVKPGYSLSMQYIMFMVNARTYFGLKKGRRFISTLLYFPRIVGNIIQAQHTIFAHAVKGKTK